MREGKQEWKVRSDTEVSERRTVERMRAKWRKCRNNVPQLANILRNSVEHFNFTVGVIKTPLTLEPNLLAAGVTT